MFGKTNNNCKQLPEGEINQVEVTYEDQKSINTFSKLINKKDTLTTNLKNLNTEKEYLDDVLLELELIDEDEIINYKISTVFLKLPQSQIIPKIESSLSSLNTEIDQLESQIDEIDSTLDTLKKKLYTKFGNTINLER